jgi:hypothetical protein
MSYAVMFRTATGFNVLLKQMYRTIDEAEEDVVESHPWIAEDQWQRCPDASIFNFTDGSCFIIYRE